MSEENWIYDTEEGMWYEWTEERYDSHIQLVKQYGVDAKRKHDDNTPET